MTGLHTLADRARIAQLGAWEVRRHGGAEHAYFARRGFLHFQLWHPDAHVSILTPSRLTGNRFAIWRDQLKISVRTWGEVAAALADLALPSATEVAALYTWTVVRDELEAGTEREERHRARA